MFITIIYKNIISKLTSTIIFIFIYYIHVSCIIQYLFLMSHLSLYHLLDHIIANLMFVSQYYETLVINITIIIFLVIVIKYKMRYFDRCYTKLWIVCNRLFIACTRLLAEYTNVNCFEVITSTNLCNSSNYRTYRVQ